MKNGKSAENLRKSIEAAKGRGLEKLLGLGIRHVGTRRFLMARAFADVWTLMAAERKAHIHPRDRAGDGAKPYPVFKDNES